MRIGIVGYGVVGGHLHRDLEGKCEVLVYDKAIHGDPQKALVNQCDAAFICVPTPMAASGAADLSAINDVFSWLKTPIAIIRSTVPPSTTERLQSKYPGKVVFVPEFIGEGVNAPYNQMRQPPFLIIGGTSGARMQAAQVLSHIYNSECEFIYVDAVTAEVAKYAENFYLALKVGWANEMYDICNAVGADFGQMMNAVTHDYRIGRSHTHIYWNDRGWDGRCLPKDLNALLAVVGKETAPLLTYAIASNEIHKARSIQ